MLTDEGSEVVEKGSHEFLVFKAVPAEGLPQAEIKVLILESSGLVCLFAFCLVHNKIIFGGTVGKLVLKIAAKVNDIYCTLSLVNFTDSTGTSSLFIPVGAQT